MAAAAEGRLPLPAQAMWEIFPFETDGLRTVPLRPPVVPEPPRAGGGRPAVPALHGPRPRGRPERRAVGCSLLPPPRPPALAEDPSPRWVPARPGDAADADLPDDPASGCVLPDEPPF